MPSAERGGEEGEGEAMNTATDAAFFCIPRGLTGHIAYGDSGLVVFSFPLATACSLSSDYADVTHGEVFTVEDGMLRVVAVMAVVR